MHSRRELFFFRVVLCCVQVESFRSLHGNSSLGRRGFNFRTKSASTAKVGAIAALESAVGVEAKVKAEMNVAEEIGANHNHCMADQFGAMLSELPQCVYQNVPNKAKGMAECQDAARKTLKEHTNAAGLCEIFTAMKNMLSGDMKDCDAHGKAKFRQITADKHISKLADQVTAAQLKQAQHRFFTKAEKKVVLMVGVLTATNFYSSGNLLFHWYHCYLSWCM